ncbi:hypothetical protein IAT38_007270 [Cryptococcus sp. DSM 104549]
MPLVGNPSLAAQLYGPSVTFVNHAAVMTASTAAASSTALNSTQVVAAEKAEQVSMSQSIAGIVYLSLAGLLLFCMIVAHPRFLARLFASICSTKKRATAPYRPAYAFSMASAQEKAGRMVSGGGLRDGWVLKKGEDKPIEIMSPTTPGTARSAYFSPVEERTHVFPPVAPRPHLLPPPHINPLMSYAPFASTFLYAPFYHFPSVLKSLINMAQIYLVVIYLIAMAFCLIWRSDLRPAQKGSGYGSDFKRSAVVAVANIPIVIALGVRGNLVGLCVGKGYDKLKVLHKVVGRVLFASASVHALGFTYTWAKAGKFATSSKLQFAVMGYLAYAALILIVISSLPWARKAFYGVFKVCHFVGMVGLLVGMAWHVDSAVPYCIASLVIYLISIICSLTKTRLASAELHALQSSETTVITIPALRSGWRAGQHVRIRVPALGLKHGLEGHPFTIASAPDGEGMVLMVKKAGDWTTKLFELAQEGQVGMSRSEAARRGRGATVILEGPYGGLGNTLLPSFSSVVLIAGGSGITHALSLAHDLVTRAPSGVVRARTIDLVWMVGTEEQAKPMMATLLELVNDAKQWESKCMESRGKGGSHAQPTALRVKVFITRCPASSPIHLLPTEECPHPYDNPALASSDVEVDEKGHLTRQPSAAHKEKLAYLARNPSAASTMTARIRHNLPLSSILVNPVRPDFHLLMSGITEETIARHAKNQTEPSGVCVTACGPDSLVHNAREAVRRLEGYKVTGCGGVEFEEERFGF